MAKLGMTEIVLILLVLGALIIPTIFFLLSLQKALTACQPDNRRMPPNNVWLLLIPLFNIIYQFIVVNSIAESLEGEFKQRNIPVEPSPGRSLGMAWCILGLCGVIPFIGALAGLAALICWILYWVKIAGLTKQLTPAMSS